MNWQELSALLALATAMSFSPGPDTMRSIALAAKHRLKCAPPFGCAGPDASAQRLAVFNRIMTSSAGAYRRVDAVALSSAAAREDFRFFKMRKGQT